MMQESLFEILGFELEETQTKEKKEKKEKKAAVKNEPTKEKKSVQQEEYVTFPIKVVTGYGDTVTYQVSDFETDKVTAKEVFQKFTSQHAAFPSSLCGYYTKKKDVIVVFVKQCYASPKIEIKANAQTKYVLGSTSLDLSAFMTNAECTIEAKTLIEAFSTEYPKYGAIRICYSITENTVIPYFAENGLYGSLSLPVDVVFWNHDGFTITAEDIANSAAVENTEMSEEAEDEDSEEDIPVNTNSTADVKASEEQLLKIVEAHYPEVKGMVRLRYNKKENSIVVVMKEDSKEANAAVKKEVVYPTDAEVSLFVHIRFKLQPEWFENKAEITEKEFRKFLEERYPEFSPERTFIVYDEKKKLIMPCLKSSSKGALSIAYTDAEEQDLLDVPFPFPIIREYEDGSTYRVESTPVADFRVCMNGDGSRNSFHYKLPKIPYTMIVTAQKFFQNVYRKKGTEAFLQLFYDESEKSYFWHLPEQIASRANVVATRNFLKEQEFLLVADVHSHGSYSAFWSDIDCKDEKGSRVFGVMGSFHKDVCTECFRIGCGGYFSELEIRDIVDYDALEQEDVENMLWFLDKRMDRIAVKANIFN